MLIRRAALILRLHATLLFFLAVALIANPTLVTRFFDFRLTPELTWSLRVVGSCLLLPALLAPLVAAFAGERGLRQAAAGMAFLSLGIGTLAFFSPAGWASSSVATALAWYFFALLYFYALRGRGRNR